MKIRLKVKKVGLIDSLDRLYRRRSYVDAIVRLHVDTVLDAVMDIFITTLDACQLREDDVFERAYYKYVLGNFPNRPLIGVPLFERSFSKKLVEYVTASDSINLVGGKYKFGTHTGKTSYDTTQVHTSTDEV